MLNNTVFKKCVHRFELMLESGYAAINKTKTRRFYMDIAKVAVFKDSTSLNC